MSSDLKRKFNHIYDYERFIGNSVALRVIESKPIGVWEFLIPIVFILHFMRNRQSREIFIQNYMFTKRHALDAAFKMLKYGLNRDEALSKVREKTKELLSDPQTKKIYSREIRQQQLNEIDLLFDNYRKLMGAEGNDFDALTRSAYGSRQNYIVFHRRLVAAEKNVSDAARQTLGSKADVGALLRIDKATEEVRQTKINNIFDN
jgi:hypothetical protein